jgi:hypothetical protein
MVSRSPLGVHFRECLGGPFGDEGSLQLVEDGTDLRDCPTVRCGQVDLPGDGAEADLARA